MRRAMSIGHDPASFGARVGAFFDEFFRLQPVVATEAGAHEHDDRWPDLTDDGRRERLAFLERWTAEFAAMDDGSLGADERVDRDLVLSELRAARFAEEDLREERWDALSYVYLLGAGIFPLLAREATPLRDRLAAITRRLEGIPAVVAAARGQLHGLPGRPVSRLHTDTAIRQVEGIVGLCDEAVVAASEGARGEPALSELEGRLAAAAESAKVALGEFRAYLADELLDRSEGEGRLGRDLFDRKLRHTLHDEISSDEILARAEREYEAVRSEMVRLARDLWPVWVPDRKLPEQAESDDRKEYESRIVGGVLAAIAAVHRSPSELLDFCRAELGRIESFVRERDLVALSEEPLEIIWTPVFLRSSAGAMLVPPGPLERNQKSFFCITPPPDDWTSEQVESALREDNDRMLRLLTIHEAVPGHYLQLARSNACRSLARTVFQDGVFIEGWAVYVTQVMLDQGYGADDPALLLTHWKFYLRSVINAIIDIRLHRGRMTEDEAVRLMVDGGFQEESEARAKWNRARLTSTQLCTYFVGSMQLWDLERARRDQLAGEPVAEQRPDGLPGRADRTAGFTYREHLDGLLSHGSPPVALLRRMVLGT